MALSYALTRSGQCRWPASPVPDPRWTEATRARRDRRKPGRLRHLLPFPGRRSPPPCSGAPLAARVRRGGRGSKSPPSRGRRPPMFDLRTPPRNWRFFSWLGPRPSAPRKPRKSAIESRSPLPCSAAKTTHKRALEAARNGTKPPRAGRFFDLVAVATCDPPESLRSEPVTGEQKGAHARDFTNRSVGDSARWSGELRPRFVSPGSCVCFFSRSSGTPLPHRPTPRARVGPTAKAVNMSRCAISPTDRSVILQTATATEGMAPAKRRLSSSCAAARSGAGLSVGVQQRGGFHQHGERLTESR